MCSDLVLELSACDWISQDGCGYKVWSESEGGNCIRGKAAGLKSYSVDQILDKKNKKQESDKVSLLIP